MERLPTSVEDAIAALEAVSEPDRPAQMLAYHKVERRYIGVSNHVINEMTQRWRQGLSLDTRIDLADGLWKTDVFEARVAAAKLLTQARLRPDDAVWRMICAWTRDFDSWAIADHAASAGQRRLLAQPDRLNEVETWTTSDSLWIRRAALVMTLPWAKTRNPTEAELAARERILGWAASYVSDPEWFIQKAVAWWLRDHSKHDPERVKTFLQAHGNAMKPFAQREAARFLPA